MINISALGELIDALEREQVDREKFKTVVKRQSYNNLTTYLLARQNA